VDINAMRELTKQQPTGVK